MEKNKRPKILIVLSAILFLSSSIGWSNSALCLRPASFHQRGKVDSKSAGLFTEENVGEFFVAWNQFEESQKGKILNQLSKPVIGKEKGNLNAGELRRLEETASKLYVGWDSFTVAERAAIVKQLNPDFAIGFEENGLNL